MGQVINLKLGLWRVFKWFFNFGAQFDADVIVLGPGTHKIRYELSQTPTTIWLYVTQPDDSIPVCQATTNLIGATIYEKGFTLSAQINSNECFVEWFAEY